MKNKKGKIGLSVSSMVSGLILLVVAFTVFATVIPEVNTAGNTINATSGLPLKSFFQANGILVLAIVAGVLLAAIAMTGIGRKK